MKKKIGLIIVQLYVFISDIFLVMLAFKCSFFLRYGSEIPNISFVAYKENMLVLIFLYILAFVIARVYKKRYASYWELFCRIFRGLCLGMMFGFMFFYLIRAKWMGFPSGIFVITFPIALVIIFTFNAIILRIAGRIKKKVVVIGKDKDLSISGHGVPLEFICIENIEDILLYSDIDEVVICEKFHDEREMNLLLYLLSKLKVKVLFSPLLYAELLSWNINENSSFSYLATFIGKRPDHEEFLIRTLDVMGSIFVLLMLSPIIMLISILIKLTSKGPVLFKQDRVAKDGKVFVLYKFRTMINNAEKKTGPVMAKKKDPRVTPIGGFMRHTRIDEIPQLFNIIKGEMSLVGPRPERPHFVKLHKALQEIRLAVKPGLTGLAQIRSMYDLHPKHKIKYDYLYIQKRSLLLNIYILAKTIPVLFLKKGW